MRNLSRRNSGNLGITRIMSHSFLADLLPRDAVVIDLGANRGTFSAEVNSRFGWRCAAVEPNPEMFKQIPRREGIVAINAAVASVDGPVTLNLAENPESSSLLALPLDASRGQVSVQGLTLQSVCKFAGVERVDLLKMDIEGAEIDLLRSLPASELSQIRQITIEFHESSGLERLPPDSSARLVNSL
jgi:FkbM family methyltransferase